MAVRSGGVAIAAGAEDRIDLVVSYQKSPCLSGRFEPSHQLFAFSCWPMRAFDPVVQTLVRPVVNFRRNIPDRLEIAPQLVRYHDTGLAEPVDQPRQKSPFCFGVPARLYKDIQRVAVRIYRPPEPNLHAIDRDDNFIQVPFVSSCKPVASDAISEMPAKPVHPFAHCLAADDNTAFGQQILEVGRAEREAMIGPYGKATTSRRKR